ncbi:response regulator transcription factor [Liquorilactobacillus mali]|uniref:Alkaline phosphatase synthesis two-component response regulator n=1 Tax=Liquorilactobacillus mali KCTC 3596 = DSM 20444 TaxID=1046596 RepID=J0L684_9LACO|nr:response regulator transcription factor [Liquorilactobacillus mali]EJF00160.1 Alkaline phosphatase synthesis two-component response regulator [Liquorilactobacillus mali KCTC 3596 = DSM 20444]KRN09590.1 Alkaline phosphatase synthesis two-component response regulator [Liquorilactobacillus mali KCTC 3596 = DSM 20444]MDC7953250.1 response regulator transcription factor [Liquorilactobacillus mali]MDV7756706.1 response regulator [Liquorilactobacillus mali]QFQ74197.1 response regulator transcripti
MKKILVVDDEMSIVTLLKYNLEQAGYEVDTALDGQTGFDKGRNFKFDFILLDLMLPRMDGLEITKRLRQEKVKTPIMILTAKGEEYDKVIGLELGADDYLTKPFSPREVIARIKAIARRTEEMPADSLSAKDITENETETEEVYRFPDFSVDLVNYSVTKNGKKVKLTPKEFELLAYFIKRKHRVLSRDKLLNGVWGFDYVGQTRMVDMHVSHLREKIEQDPKNPSYIETVRGFGYRFEGESN